MRSGNEVTEEVCLERVNTYFTDDVQIAAAILALLCDTSADRHFLWDHSLWYLAKWSPEKPMPAGLLEGFVGKINEVIQRSPGKAGELEKV